MTARARTWPLTAARFLPLISLLALVIGGFLYAHFSPGFDPSATTAVPYLGPSAEHLLGTDKLGRDVAARLLVGGTGLLAIAAALAAIVTTLGAVLGALAALRSRVATVLRWITDGAVLMPSVLAMLVLGAALGDAGIATVAIIGVALGTPYTAKVLMPAATVVTMSGHVEAAEGLGETLPRLVFVEILPALKHTVFTVFGLRFVEATYLVSTAAFLHIPTGLSDTNWALSVRENGSGLLLNPAAALAPALAIAIASIAATLLTRTPATLSRSAAVMS